MELNLSLKGGGGEVQVKEKRKECLLIICLTGEATGYSYTQWTMAGMTLEGNGMQVTVFMVINSESVGWGN